MDRRAAFPSATFRSLDPADFSFYGFGDSLRRVGRKVRSVGIRTGEPKVAVVEGAIFLPAESRQHSGQPKAFGGVVTAKGWPVELAQVHRQGRTLGGSIVAPVAVAPAREVDEEVVYLGPLFNHFGRVLLECLARVWYVKEVDPSVRVVFDYPNLADRTHQPWVLRILELFGIPASRILVLDAPTRVGRAFVPEPLFEQLSTAHRELIRPYREVAARIAADCRPSRQPVYLSRRLLSSRQRPIVGELELEDVLRENGFLVAHPETMTFDDQVRLFNGHADIVSSVGSAAHTVLFALNRPALHLLTHGDRIPTNYFLCSALAEAPTTFVNCLGTGGRPSFDAERKAEKAEGPRSERDTAVLAGAGPQATPQIPEMRTLTAYLEARGFLTKRLRASLAGRSPALRDQYDEAWLYGRIRKSSAKRGSTLPPEVESEALGFAATSWPVSSILARYYVVARRGASHVDAMAKQFAELAAAEFDVNRLVHYRDEVESMAARVARVCQSETADRLAEVLADRFRIDLARAGEPAPDDSDAP